MPSVVVDTCVLSALFKGSPLAASYRPHIVGNRLVISFQTLAELYRWPLERSWGDRRRRDLETFIRRRCVLYPYNPALCRQWADATYEAGQNGYTLPAADGWILSRMKPGRVGSPGLLYGLTRTSLRGSSSRYGPLRLYFSRAALVHGCWVVHQATQRS